MRPLKLKLIAIGVFLVFIVYFRIPYWGEVNQLPNSRDILITVKYVFGPKHEEKHDQKSYLESLELRASGYDYQFIEKNCHYNLPNTASVMAKICLYPDEMDQHVSKIIKSGAIWEEPVQKVIFNQVVTKHTDAAIVDIGANLGSFSIVAAKLGRQTFAFDLTMDTLRYLSQSVHVNNLEGLLHVYPTAVMEKRFQCIGRQSNPNSTLNPGGNSVKFIENCDEEASPVATLDDLLPIFHKMGIEKAIIKADCEGSEPRVVLGGQKFLREISVPFIQMEWNIVKQDLKKKDSNYKHMVNLALQVMSDLKFVPVTLGGTLENSLESKHYSEWPYEINWIKRDS